MAEGVGPLDLSGADLKGFEALEPGRYGAEIFEIKWDSVKNASGQGSLPAGTPMLKVQFKITHDPAGEDMSEQNRRTFANYFVPPKSYDKAKGAKMKGMMARFFMALDIPEETVVAKDFDPDFDELKGTPVMVTLGKEQKRDQNGEPIEGEFNNPVKGVRPAGELASSGGGLL